MNKSSETLGKLFEALAKAQGVIKGSIKDSKNPFFKSEYSSLSSCWDACRAPLSENGLSVVQSINDENGRLSICTILGHSSGEYISSTLPLLSKTQDAQAIGSVISYMRRYALCAIVGISQTDDDGEEAMARNAPQSTNGSKTTPTYPQDKIVDPEPKEEGSLMTFEQFNFALAETSDLINPKEPKLMSYIYEICSHTKSGKPIAVQKMMEQGLKMPERFVNSFLEWKKIKESREVPTETPF